jgi:dTDP-4-amino-4,6-dideoxygalactose transaminase
MSRLALHGGSPYRSTFLGFHRPLLGELEEQAVLETLRSGWLTTGQRTREFEAAFAEYTGVERAVGVNSCTAALHLALVACGVKPGDEVITSPISFASSANVIVHAGARPVFADIDAATLNISPASIEAAITPKTRAIMPVHMAGVACDAEEILRIARRHDIAVIGDAAHAIETRIGDQSVARYADLTAYSFYATKNITTGEGGMLVTNREEWADNAQVLSLHGISRDAWKRYTDEGYRHWDIICPGYKYNMYDLQAALGLVQLSRIEQMLARRTELTLRYHERLRDAVPEATLQAVPEGTRSAHHLMIVVLATDDLSVDRDVIMSALQAENIGIGIHFRAIHLHPYYHEEWGFRRGMFPVAESVSDNVLSLPLYPSMSDSDVDDAVGALEKVIAAYR